MDLDYNRAQNANKIHTTIKNFEWMFPYEFEKCAIKQCSKCGKSGLTNKYDMIDYCSNCHGVGYIGFEKIYGEHICRGCNAVGCEKCEGEGIVDWITHAMGSDIGDVNDRNLSR